MASAEREPIQGFGGGAPSGVQGRAPGQGVRWRSPHEAGDILYFKFRQTLRLLLSLDVISRIYALTIEDACSGIYIWRNLGIPVVRVYNAISIFLFYKLSTNFFGTPRCYSESK
jgi:hypothetical protein